MGRLAVIVVGLGMVAAGVYGVQNARRAFDEEPVVRKDLQATGTVTRLEATELKHATGLVINTTYRMYFSFVAEDGEVYHGEENIERHEAMSLAEGDTVKVKYHSNQPSLNAAPAYGHYVSVTDIPRASPMTRLGFCAGFCVMGVLLLIGGLFGKGSDAADAVVGEPGADSMADHELLTD